MSSGYKCKRCGVISERREHVCQPREVEYRAEFCSFKEDNFDMMCDSIAENMNFQCDICGRPTEKPNMVCSPTPIRRSLS